MKGDKEKEKEVDVDEEVGGSKEEKETNKMTKVRRKSLIEFLVMCTPLLHVAFIVYPVLYYLNPDIPILLISVFPPQSRNPLTICICLSCETLLIFVLCAWTTYTTFAIISFILTFKDTVDLIMKRISK